jgi:osmoprotectant transport system substrate-binding protein
MNTRTPVTIAVIALVLSLALVATGCSSTAPGGSEERTVTVGSKIDTEGGVLGQMIIALLEEDGFTVVDKTKTGATDVVRSALESGEIDIYPEYTGTALTQFFPGATIDPSISKDAQASYDTVAEIDAEGGITWLERAPANNTWAIAIPRTLAEANGIVSLADWAEYINADNPVKLVASQEFVDRDDALKAFEAAYGFDLGSDQLIILAGGDTAQTEAAAAQGTNGANAAMAYGTDGSLAALDLVVLSDPAGVQPVYEPAPSIRTEVLEAYPEIADILNPVFRGLTLETLQELNGKVAVDGMDPKTVARDYLKAEGYIK